MNQAPTTAVDRASKGDLYRSPLAQCDSPTFRRGRAVVMFGSSERLEGMLRAEGFWVFNA